MMSTDTTPPTDGTDSGDAATLHSGEASVSAIGSGTISIFATFATEPEWERRMERCSTRKQAADAVRVARGKGGFDINIIDRWSEKPKSPN